MDCTDLLSVAVQAIVNLGAASTPTDIWGAMVTLCPASGIVLTDVQDTLTAGVRCGVLAPCYNTPATTLLYEVNLDMRRLKAGNDRYYAIVDPTQPAST